MHLLAAQTRCPPVFAPGPSQRPTFLPSVQMCLCPTPMPRAQPSGASGPAWRRGSSPTDACKEATGREATLFPEVTECNQFHVPSTELEARGPSERQDVPCPRAGGDNGQIGPHHAESLRFHAGPAVSGRNANDTELLANSSSLQLACWLPAPHLGLICSALTL